MIPVRATYRVQFSAGFRFADGAALAPYLASLGISHVYASPVFAARSGSTHGYDVTDYNRLNPDLGTEAEFQDMVQVLRQHGLGLILDFVPNHMGIGGADNLYWESVLEWGPQSPYAHWFDIDWQAEGMDGKVLFPFLGAAYGTVLATGGLRLRLNDAGRLAVWAHDTHRLPICPQHYGEVLGEAGSPLADEFAALREAGAQDARWPALHARLARSGADLSAFDDPARLGSLIGRQHWRAAKFNLDADAINYRRFFTISDLAGVRVEDEAVFDQTHALVLSYLREGLVDGIRIDHIDGLRDPRGYCARLRAAVGRPLMLFVEKILGPGEDLPRDWHADGTTGYEFANQLMTVMADPAGREALGHIYRNVTGCATSPAQIVQEGKLSVLAGPMRAEARALCVRVVRLAAQVPEWADLGSGAIRESLTQAIAGLDIYRSYADACGIAPEGRTRITAALERARAAAPHLDPACWELLAEMLTLDARARFPGQSEEILEVAMRFQQLSGPVMAKGLEDRALYRFNRLIALNEVGSHPGEFGLPVAGFHAAQARRLRQSPRGMLCTSSHDTKRGEDARARILAIASHTGLWQQKLAEWRAVLGRVAAQVDPNEEYFFYQLLLGSWPEDDDPGGDFPERVTEAMLKSVREAGVNSRWVFGDAGYEDRIRELVQTAASSPAFRASFTDFCQRIRPEAEAASLIQTALKLTVPGVPDIYQGAEMLDLSLVDPDNRCAVDYTSRIRGVAQVDGGSILSEGLSLAQVKLRMVATLLRWRAEQPALFARGSYQALSAQGPAAAGFLGFMRSSGPHALIVAAALHPACHPTQAWNSTQVSCEKGNREWHNLVTGESVDPRDTANLFHRLPLAILRSDG